MVALGVGAQDTVSEDVSSAGTNLIQVRAGNYTTGGESMNIATGRGSANTLTADDADAAGQIEGVKYYSPFIRYRAFVSGDGQRNYTQVYGTGADYGRLYMWNYARGKYFSASDVKDGASVAVIGIALRGRLFGDVNPVGKEIQIHNQAFRVVGVTSTSDEDQIEMAFVPYTTLQKLLGFNFLHGITLSAKQAGDTTRIVDEIKPLLRRRHNLESSSSRRDPGLIGNQMPTSGTAGYNPDDFTVKTQAAEALTKGLYTSVAAFVLANMPKVDQINMEEMAGTLTRAGSTMTALLAAIAAISLIVGGIGIMNIMMVSVTERTREIGIRRATGARQRDVMLQFLVEAVTLSLIGGSVGILLGLAASFVVTRIFEWPTSVSLWSIALAVGIAGAVGMFFGFYPARRASLLNPIDALRSE
jgi:ABC-type antimicrobial peptide transport system permease subunit